MCQSQYSTTAADGARTSQGLGIGDSGFRPERRGANAELANTLRPPGQLLCDRVRASGSDSARSAAERIRDFSSCSVMQTAIIVYIFLSYMRALFCTVFLL